MLVLSQTMNSIASIAQLFSLVCIFLFVCAITYFTTRFISKTMYQQGNMGAGNLEIIETYRIAPGKCIQIVRVGKKYLVLAICKESITFLSQLEEDEIQIVEKKEAVSFKELLEKAKKKAIKRADKDE